VRLPLVEPCICPVCGRGMTPAVTHRQGFSRYATCGLNACRLRIDYHKTTLAVLRVVAVDLVPKDATAARS